MLSGIGWATSVSRQVSSQFKETISAVSGVNQLQAEFTFLEVLLELGPNMVCLTISMYRSSTPHPWS